MSQELFIIKEYFKTFPMMEPYIANIIEKYIYTVVNEYFEDGTIKSQHITKYGKDGEYKEYYKDGTIKCQYMTKYGIKEGEYKEYFENGNVNLKVNYINGERHGILRHYNINRRLICIAKYKNGKETFNPCYEKQLLRYWSFGKGGRF